MKILGKLIILVIGITLLYFLLSQINWMQVFKTDQNQNKLEKKLGKLVFDSIKHSYDIVEDDSIQLIVDSIFQPLIKENTSNPKNYTIHLINSSEVNAFALPDDQIIVTSGLVNFLDSSNYLSAVLAHEIAHCEKNHVMKSLITNYGLEILLSGSSTGEITNFLSGQAFSRSLEKEADETAVSYLTNTEIDPNSLVHVMELFDIFLSSGDDLSWISSHPNPSDRKTYIQNKINKEDISEKSFKKPIKSKTWLKFQELLDSPDKLEEN